jgi:hypothetical protein
MRLYGCFSYGSKLPELRQDKYEFICSAVYSKHKIKSSNTYIVKVQYGIASEDKINPHAFEKIDSGLNHGRGQAVFFEFSHDGRLADI